MTIIFINMFNIRIISATYVLCFLNRCIYIYIYIERERERENTIRKKGQGPPIAQLATSHSRKGKPMSLIGRFRKRGFEQSVSILHEIQKAQKDMGKVFL